MKTKHTPGPWIAGYYKATETFKQRINEELQAAIVQDVDCNIENRGMLVAICGDFKDEQSRYDSILMAAAPELLETLDHLHKRLVSLANSKTTPRAIASAIYNIIAGDIEVTKVIAKATGKEEAASV